MNRELRASRRALRVGALLTLSSLLAVTACSAKLNASLSTQVGNKDEAAKENLPPEPVAPPADTHTLLEQAVAGTHRSEENRARDVHRHPVETLEFFGLQPEMTVVELNGAPGWYTEILAPVLSERGKLYVTIDDPEGNPEDPRTQYAQDFVTTLGGAPELAKVETRVVKQGEYEVAPEASVDLVLSFRNSHLWWRAKNESEVMAAIYKALRPGGRFGLVTHRAPEDAKLSRVAQKGYLPEAHVIEVAAAAGFELVARSEVNANPKDTKNYPMGVWALPPVLGDNPRNKDKYLEIGESDRMTLVFRKPGAPDISEQLAGAAAAAKAEFEKAKAQFDDAKAKAAAAVDGAIEQGKETLDKGKEAVNDAAKGASDAAKGAAKVKKPKKPKKPF